jgi:pimeloyl-ACP methyl ester carboxylesterase
VDEEQTFSTERTTGKVRRSRRHRVIRISLISVAVLIALFYAAGGWYFSTQLGGDAFVVDDDRGADEFDLEIVAIGDSSVTIRGEADQDAGLTADGQFGLELPNGWLHVGEIEGAAVVDGYDTVTRSLDRVFGTTPSSGTPADLDAWFWEATPADLDLEYQDVVFESPVGQFDAWLVPAVDDTWAIVIHGKGAQRREGLRILESINAAGHPALIMTYRNDPGQPADPSGYYRYGETEWADVEAAVRYAVDNGAKDVVLVGLSTGAAHALGFYYESGLSDRVSGAIFDSPNIDFGRTVDYGAAQRTLPVVGTGVPQSLTTVAKWISSFRYQVDWSQLDFIDDADRIEFPILVFHGTDDSTVPLDVSRRLHDELPDLVTLVTVEGAEHVQSWNTDPQRYEVEVSGFFESIG